MAKCNYSKCDFVLFRDVCNKVLTEDQLISLIKTGSTAFIKGFKNKEGRKFDASIVLDQNCRARFKYPDKR
ncbi:topoisomerase C-terminal repeat-containing protein [Dysgonomonas sp. ZJ709]|uniref:topoisomerase C-terminal repeat-containing protein n=1 Tax=Dysgonomonas sp. ZJ709 TaxID=2709797 RepID=UPI0013EE38F9